MMKRKIATFAMVAGTVAAALGTGGAAYAAGPSGSEACPSGSACLYFNSPEYGWGSYEHWSPGYYWLSNYTFSNWGNGSGYGQSVADHAAAFVNNTTQTWYVCPQSGACEPYPPGYSGRLGGTYNNDWSFGV
ncbi:MAG TPA: hypothetical protein VL551_04995 [Actinospica sp.]|jgi:hypothetical protein|nr:hypothetical protein [Actinospica sp.]